MTKDRFLYTGRKTNEISFPLGGIGTGSIGLAGNGRLIDWEIFNRPNKNSLNGFSHFAIKAEKAGRLIDARVLQGDLHPPYTGSGGHGFAGFGFGPAREHLAGLPHFAGTAFRGAFPFARLECRGADAFPGQTAMTAFNPFIPLNDIDSGIPAAFFEIEVTNRAAESIDYTVAGTLNNPLPSNNINTIECGNGISLLRLATDGLKTEDPRYGDLTLATDASGVSGQQYWFGGAWFDSLEVYWRDFAVPGELRNRTASGDTGSNRPGMLAARLRLSPGETGRVRFVIAWNFPNCENYWNPEARESARQRGLPATWKNHYATLWQDSAASARYALEHWDRLRRETALFQEALLASDLPPAALEAVSANLAVLKTPTVMRLEDGTFYGFEGCNPAEGCCEGSCTHVWNYAQALPFLFPALERSMREADYRYNRRPDGGMPFRLQLPPGAERSRFRPCADGQFGGVMKVYRDWKISGDTEWLKKLWPDVKASIEFAWAETNEDRWDPGKTGVLQGRQHHTLDVELFGPNAWLTGFYLGALKAGAEMAELLGETECAAEYRAIFRKGKAWADANLFNGEYYCQKVDIANREILEPFGDAGDAYWDEEHGEIKYQIAGGCEIDQVLAQWHANLYGLGEIYDPAQVETALRSLFRYNFRPRMRDYFNACRVYCLNDESGLVIAHWPEHVYRPVIPIPYAGETQNGYEWAACVQMIQSGLLEEGMTCVEAIRDRYDGEKRNPWNEFECGSNYARSMASYSLLNAFSGFRFDMARGMIGFNPLAGQDRPFRCFWCLDSGWGRVRITESAASLQVLAGHLTLNSLQLSALAGKAAEKATLSGKKVAYRSAGDALHFREPVTIREGQRLAVRFSVP